MMNDNILLSKTTSLHNMATNALCLIALVASAVHNLKESS